MLSYIKKYPISLFIILTVIYLSFFKPPKTDLDEIPNLDKLVHVCMYLGMSGMLWLEFLRAHRRDNAPIWHAWVGAFLCPVLFSGCVELLQEYCTTYRGGDWLDFAANTTGAILASLIAYYVVRPRMMHPIFTVYHLLFTRLFFRYKYSTVELSLIPLEPLIRIVYPLGLLACRSFITSCALAYVLKECSLAANSSPTSHTFSKPLSFM